MTKPNIVLTGFMGTGKSSTGRVVADRLGWPFIDLDERISARAGKPVARIFAEDGEPAFRQMEAEACQELSEGAGLVVATGGGAVLRAENRAALLSGGIVICLEAAPDAIAGRLKHAIDRPMLAGKALGERIAELLAERAAAYSSLPHHIDTTHLSVARVADRVLAITAGLPDGAYRLPVRTPDSIYDILIAEGLLAEAGSRLLSAGIKPGRCAVISNPTVALHHADTLLGALRSAGFETHLLLAPDGEAHKTLDTVADLYKQLTEIRLARNEPVIALGGGVIGDTAGFVAATWLRGVPFVQMPTTLLSMVDASVGGKVGVDLPGGKNLVGAFKQPELVLIDPDVLRTLPGAEYRSGLAEVVKAGIIGHRKLFEQLAGDGPESLSAMIAQAVRVKVDLVQRDPFEAGDRAWLNLGHTFGHALELHSGFTLRHGDAVAVGMVAAARLSELIGACNAGLAEHIGEVLARLGLPTRVPFDPDAVIAAMGTDKKRRGRTLRFVVIERIGKVALVEDVPGDAVEAALAAVQASTGPLRG